MSYQQPYRQPTPMGGPGADGRGAFLCPFCGGTSASQFCNWCGRDTTAPRRPCPGCWRMAPTAEQACWNCGAKFKTNSTSWKILLIILLSALAIALRVLISMAR